jgi:hypothetical protein
MSVRGALALVGSDAADDIFGGVNAGVRLQVPSRVAPFVGVGGFVGYSRERTDASDDLIDNDDDGSIDELGEEKTRSDGGFVSIYPEVGVHVWLNSSTRLTASAAYNITTEGRDHDFWFIGIGLSFLLRSEEPDWGDFLESSNFEDDATPPETRPTGRSRLVEPIPPEVVPEHEAVSDHDESDHEKSAEQNKLATPANRFIRRATRNVDSAIE